MEKIVIIGAGGHAKTIVDTLERLGCYDIVGFVDKNVSEKPMYKGYKVIGTDDDLQLLYESGIKNAFIAIGFLGDSTLRQKIYDKLLKIGFNIPSVIDPTAIVACDAIIGEGTYVGRGSVVNVSTCVGQNCIINSAAVIEHDCIIGDFTHVAVGAVVCGQVSVGENTLIGANATVIQCKNIGSNCVVGAGTVVRRDVTDKKIVVGDIIK